jgi:hypothetical protein
MKLMIGLMGGLFVFGTVGSLENDFITFNEALVRLAMGFVFCGFALSEIEVG